MKYCGLSVCVLLAVVWTGFAQVKRSVGLGSAPPIAYSLGSGLTLTVSAHRRTNKYVALPRSPRRLPAPAFAQRVTVKGAVLRGGTAGELMIRPLVVSPMHGLLHGQAYRLVRDTRARRAIGRALSAAGGVPLWMAWHGTVESVAADGSAVLRDLDSYRVLTLDFAALSKAVAAMCAKSELEIQRVLGSDPGVRALLTLNGKIDSAWLVARLVSRPATLRQGADTVSYDPNNGLAELRWPSVNLGNWAEEPGRERVYVVRRHFLVETSPVRVRELAISLSGSPVPRQGVR